ncbi:MAG: flagellar biosynthesis anti-sigma factor FlgM [Burkholderiaceae bacterium]
MKVDSSPDSYIGSVAGGPQKVADKAPAGAEAAAGAAGAAAAGAAAKPQAAAGVTVSLSASTTQALSGAGSSSDVFNAEKVESMKQAIANGTFQVNAEAIADKMLANAAEMLGSSKSA